MNLDLALIGKDENLVVFEDQCLECGTLASIELDFTPFDNDFLDDELWGCGFDTDPISGNGSGSLRGWQGFSGFGVDFVDWIHLKFKPKDLRTNLLGFNL